jgi:hypothetical protein
MSDARWGDPREKGERDRDDGRRRVYDERDRDDHDPRDGLMHDLELPCGEERELVVDRDCVYELTGEDTRTLAAVGTFRVVPEEDLDIDHDTLGHLRAEGLVDPVALAKYRSLYRLGELHPSLVRTIWAYAWGPPKEPIENEKPLERLVIMIQPQASRGNRWSASR